VVDTFTRGMYDVMLEIHVKTEAAPRWQVGSPRASTLKRTAWLGGSSGQQFVITVPLDEKQAKSAPDAEEDDEDVGEPPPM
jgi:type VI secretion system protein ImpH